MDYIAMNLPKNLSHNTHVWSLVKMDIFCPAWFSCVYLVFVSVLLGSSLNTSCFVCFFVNIYCISMLAGARHWISKITKHPAGVF